MTLLAAQTDFTEAGELTLFIDESQVDFLEDIMWDQGYLDTRQMAGAFQLLRSNDLIWSRVENEYLMGERADERPHGVERGRHAHALPHASEYLRGLFLDNDLARVATKCDGRPVALERHPCPDFRGRTSRDHVAPWRSVYKIQSHGRHRA